jgi:glycerophosphoryl diester phosphodiesterase
LKTIKLIAHRGLHKGKETPENSMLAFQKAVEKNYGIELDITISKDNQIVVFHDETLNRLCNVNGNIEDFEYSFLKKLKLYETQEHIPLFSEVLDLTKNKVPLIIEIKKHKSVGILETKLCELLNNYAGEYYICSFEKEILFWFRKNKPNLKRGLIFETNIKRFEKYNKTLFLYKYFKTKPDFISLDYRLIDSSIYEFCVKNNLPIFSWTINSKEKYKKIRKKVSGIIFEF